MSFFGTGNKRIQQGVLLLGALVSASILDQAQSVNVGAPSAIGTATGGQAPNFHSRDQFGQEQSNETLRGSNGTVLLFFRSADW